MSQADAKIFLKKQTRDYLESQFGVDASKRFCCIDPEHDDKHPSAGYDATKQIVHCFSHPGDKKSWDIFDLVQIRTGLTSFKDKFAHLCELYDIEIVGGYPSENHIIEEKPKQTKGELTFLDLENIPNEPIIEPDHMDPVQEVRKYFNALFKPNDFVGYSSRFYFDQRKNKHCPSAGVYDRTASNIIEQMKETQDPAKAFTEYDMRQGINVEYDPQFGALIRFNPLDGQGIKDVNVTEHRYALIECDDMAIERQKAIMLALELPIAIMVYSGNKSVHSIVRIDAKDRQEYDERLNFIYEVCTQNGLTIDKQNRNPSRLSRLPGFERDGHKQFVIAENIGKPSFEDWKKWVFEQTDPTKLTGKFENLDDYFQSIKNKQTDYYQKRGFTPDEINQFANNDLIQFGYDSTFNYKIKPTDAIVFRTGYASFTARLVHPIITKEGNQIKCIKGGTSGFFNFSALNQFEKPIFIVEGEFDALSILACDGQAVSLGTVDNVRKFIEQISIRTDYRQNNFILALDNDNVGQIAQKELANQLAELKANYCILSDFEEFQDLKYKDFNDFFVNNKEKMKAIIQDISKYKSAKQREYMKSCHVVNRFTDFIKRRENPKDQAIMTGFQELDKLMAGGLHAGLYCFGARPGVGKSTFIMQMADFIATNGKTTVRDIHANTQEITKEGHDVLVFALEMSTNQLIARSTSRLTYERTLNTLTLSHDKIQNECEKIHEWARNQNEMQNSLLRRNDTTKDAQRNIDASLNKYMTQIAPNMYIHESVWGFTVSDIVEKVNAHIEMTGHKPVVIVDYLQIIQPEDIRMTDKQAVDVMVMKLKKLSRDHSIPVIAISSFNRTSYKTQASEISFKDSGNIEFTADVLMALQFQGMPNEGDSNSKFDFTQAKQNKMRKMEISIIKNRLGVPGTKAYFDYSATYNCFMQAPKPETNSFKKDAI